ncbi:MAG TPA: NTP transferase domain-containing protein, partial [Candidatus Berkiella sp.]|nr:NTP transferase domain-containing protein [Candidatus Berkiella sp.]
MRSSLAKVLHPLGAKPLLWHVIESAKTLNPAQIIVVFGHEGEALQAAFKNENITWVHQTTQQGTGDAVKSALPFIKEEHQVCILYGDVPLIQQKTLARLIAKTSPNTMGLLTAKVDNPSGLGRIIRDAKQQVLRIVEEKDADVQEKTVKEINTGIFLLQAASLKRWVAKLTNHNAQQEYYLTDIVQFAVEEKIIVNTDYPQDIHEI